MLNLGKKNQMLRFKDSRSYFGAEENGTGKKPSPDSMFGESRGVPFPAPVRYKMTAEGAGKPEVRRKGRAA